MKSLKSISDNLTCFFLLLAEVLVFYLYELPAEAEIYLGGITVLIFGVRYVAGRVRSHQRREQIAAVKKEAGAYLDPAHFPEAVDAAERDYQELACILEQRCKRAEREKNQKLDEAKMYYTRWSHQIKTPIAGMRLLLGETSIDRKAMERELYHTEQYVEAVLQYQRLEGSSRDLVIRRCSVEGMVKQAVKKAGVLFRQKNLAAELGNLDAEVVTDEKWLVFVLEQLLTNAVKYTQSGKISVYLEPEKEKTLVSYDVTYDTSNSARHGF